MKLALRLFALFAFLSILPGARAADAFRYLERRL